MKREYQDRVDDFMLRCFGREISNDKVERIYRFIEEALELAQAIGATRRDLDALLAYVYGRDAGEPRQEVGGVMVTLAALCSACDFDLAECANHEIARCELNIENIRAKHASKPVGVRTPLPGGSQHG